MVARPPSEPIGIGHNVGCRHITPKSDCLLLGVKPDVGGGRCGPLRASEMMSGISAPRPLGPEVLLIPLMTADLPRLLGAGGADRLGRHIADRIGCIHQARGAGNIESIGGRPSSPARPSTISCASPGRPRSSAASGRTCCSTPAATTSPTRAPICGLCRTTSVPRSQAHGALHACCGGIGLKAHGGDRANKSNLKRGDRWARVRCMHYFGAQGTAPADPVGAGHAFGPPWAWS